MAKNLPEGLKGQILEVLFSVLKPEDCLVILFGSTALGKATRLSDLDLGIDCIEPIDDGLFLELQNRLNLEVDTPKRIELLELKRAEISFLQFALKGAVIWHAGGNYLRRWFGKWDVRKG